MKTASLHSRSRKPRGASLIEAMVAVGVIAVAVPLVMGTMAESGETGLSAQAETRSSWIVPACLSELKASRDGKALYFPKTERGESLPAGHGLLALGFAPDGRLLGAVDQANYNDGLRQLGGQSVRFIATLASEPEDPALSLASPLQKVRVTLEYPSAVPAEKRQKLDFYTRIP